MASLFRMSLNKEAQKVYGTKKIIRKRIVVN
jgi:hypothetical protein